MNRFLAFLGVTASILPVSTRINRFTPIHENPGIFGPVIPIDEPIIVLDGNGFNYFKMQPFVIANITYGEFAFAFDTTSIAHVTLKIINDLYPNGITFYDEQVLATREKQIFSYDNRYTRANNSLFVEVTVNGSTTSVTKEMDTINMGSSYINKSSIKSSNRTLSYNGKTWNYSYESYDFMNFDSDLIPNYYHELELFDLSINASNKNLLVNSNCNINLFISNRNNLFSSFEHDESYSEIPVELYEDSLLGSIKLKFKNLMYVEPSSLLMSPTYKSGYVPTYHFYFPRNEMRYQGEYEIILSFADFGVEKSTLIYSFKIKALINTLGDCYNSEFCIIASDTEVEENKGVIV